MPVPMSPVELPTVRRPSGVRVAMALDCIIIDSQMPVAMPQPTSSRPSRMERGSGLRFAQPKRSAPCVKQLFSAFEPKGLPFAVASDSA